MPLALPGALTILLAQAGTMPATATVPTAALPPRHAAIIQRDDNFVIVATDTLAKPAIIAPLPIGRAVHIDRVLMATSALPTESAPR